MSAPLTGASAAQSARRDNEARRRSAALAAAGGDVPLAFIDGHDDAIVGVAFEDDMARVVYDQAAIVRRLMARDGMPRDGALEFFEYNIEGAMFGMAPPLFVTLI